MWISQILICISVIYSCHANTKQCEDCRLYRSCPEAIKYAAITKDNEIKNKKLTSSLCGVEMVDGKKLPKVCCSEYRTTEDRSGFTENIGPKDAIETHKNIALLPKECGNIDGGRIIGGTVPNLYELPWMALVSQRSRVKTGKDNLDFRCGGTIINSRYILTAAHCVVNKKLNKVRIGEFDLGSDEDCQGEYPELYCEANLQDINIEESIPHEDFARSPSINDIALLRLEKEIDFSHKNAAPICLPLQSQLRNITISGRTGTVAGWGVTDTGRKSLTLQKVNIPILAPSDCHQKNAKISPQQICAGELGKDSCSGDSGGPLTLENEVNDRYKIIQYGIVSYGPIECGSSTPGVYTDVTKYMEWILNHIRS